MRCELYAVKTVTETGGRGEDPTDEEIIAGIQLLARTEGVFTETAGGVTIASLARMAGAGTFSGDETVVALITHHLLDSQGRERAELLREGRSPAWIWGLSVVLTNATGSIALSFPDPSMP